MDSRRSGLLWWLLLLLALLLFGCSSRMNLSRASTQVGVGVRAAQQNLWREALFRFQRAVQIDPADSMAHNNLAVAYEGIGEFDKARAEYTEALRLDQTNQYIQKNYSRFVEFNSKNKKRQKVGAVTPASTSAPAPSTAPVIPPPIPGPQPPDMIPAPPPGVPAPPSTVPPTPHGGAR